MAPGLFLDRDGVIIVNRSSYVCSWGDVVFYPGALTALRRIRSSPYKVILVTNQSAVGRGIISISQAEEINARVVEAIQQAGGCVEGVYMCPHTPEDGCACRKPQPGLILQAARELFLDVDQSILIGDALSDILAGQAAGIRHTILVRTGRGSRQVSLPYPPGTKSFTVLPDLFQALLAQNWLSA
jgi:D-glycero-D-manno-heptose 1,7-bisphosphate phosphatase